MSKQDYTLGHWELIAHRLTIDCILSAAISLGWGPEEKDQARMSIPQQIASKRLIELAKAEDPALFEKLLEERDLIKSNIESALVNLFSK